MEKFTFDVTSANFDEQVMRSPVPVLIDFTAEWCPPCKMIKPFVNDIARKYGGKLKVGTLDIDNYPGFPDRYGVMGFPTLILFRNGEPVQRVIGYKSQERIEAALRPYLPE